MRRQRRGLAACLAVVCAEMSSNCPRRRGLAGQYKRLYRMREIRKSAVAIQHLARKKGVTQEFVARALGVDVRTLRRWQRSWKEERMPIRLRGRPPVRTDVSTRQKVLACFQELGPSAGLPTLWKRFPEVARGELVEMQWRYRRAWKHRRHLLLHIVDWKRVGSVWAMDHGYSPLAMDGMYESFLAVRDLASCTTLAGIPVPDQTATMSIAVLEGLVRVHGAPLVIKADNGAGFRSDEMKTWLSKKGILPLYSPRWTPEYNGSIEAGIGGLKVRTEHQAIIRGRPGVWTSDDLQAAVEQGNELCRPWGLSGPSPNDAWAGRERIQEDERNALRESYSRYHDAEKEHRGHAVDAELQHVEQSSIDRLAIRQALVEGGYLMFQRRRIAPPVSKWKADNIT